MNKKVLGLNDFLKKASENEEKKVKVTHINVEGFGLIEFVRPRDGIILDYLQEVIDSVDKTVKKVHEEEDGKKKISVEEESSKVNLRTSIAASEKFVYLCCPMLQAKEVLEKYKDSGEPYEIPTLAFGHNQTMEIASELSALFDGTATRKKVEEEIKN